MATPAITELPRWVRIPQPAAHRAACRAAGELVLVTPELELWICDGCNAVLRSPEWAPDRPVEPVIIGPDGWGVLCARCREEWHGGAWETLQVAVDCSCPGCAP